MENTPRSPKHKKHNTTIFDTHLLHFLPIQTSNISTPFLLLKIAIFSRFSILPRKKQEQKQEQSVIIVKQPTFTYNYRLLGLIIILPLHQLNETIINKLRNNKHRVKSGSLKPFLFFS